MLDDPCPADLQGADVRFSRLVDEVFNKAKRPAVTRTQKWVCPESSSGGRCFHATPKHRLIPPRVQHRNPPSFPLHQDSGDYLGGKAFQQLAPVHDALGQIGGAKENVGVGCRRAVWRRQAAGRGYLLQEIFQVGKGLLVHMSLIEGAVIACSKKPLTSTSPASSSSVRRWMMKPVW